MRWQELFLLFVSKMEASNTVSDNCGHSENACFRANKSIPKINNMYLPTIFSLFLIQQI